MTLDAHHRRLENMYLAAEINRSVFHGVKIKIQSGKSEIIHAVEPQFFHAAKSLHGSVYFKLLDDAAYFAASSLVEDEFLLTASFQINLLRPVTVGLLRAEGWIEKPGKRVIIAQAMLYDDRNRRVAVGHGQLMKSGKMLSETQGYISRK